MEANKTEGYLMVTIAHEHPNTTSAIGALHSWPKNIQESLRKKNFRDERKFSGTRFLWVVLGSC